MERSRCGSKNPLIPWKSRGKRTKRTGDLCLQPAQITLLGLPCLCWGPRAGEPSPPSSPPGSIPPCQLPAAFPGTLSVLFFPRTTENLQSLHLLHQEVQGGLCRGSVQLFMDTKCEELPGTCQGLNSHPSLPPQRWRAPPVGTVPSPLSWDTCLV